MCECDDELVKTPHWRRRGNNVNEKILTRALQKAKKKRRGEFLASNRLGFQKFNFDILHINSWLRRQENILGSLNTDVRGPRTATGN